MIQPLFSGCLRSYYAKTCLHWIFQPLLICIRPSGSSRVYCCECMTQIASSREDSPFSSHVAMAKNDLSAHASASSNFCAPCRLFGYISWIWPHSSKRHRFDPTLERGRYQTRNICSNHPSRFLQAAITTDMSSILPTRGVSIELSREDIFRY